MATYVILSKLCARAVDDPAELRTPIPDASSEGSLAIKRLRLLEAGLSSVFLEFASAKS